MRWTAGEHDEEYDESVRGASPHASRPRSPRPSSALGPRGTAVVFTSGGPIAWAVAARSARAAAPDLWLRLNPVTVNAGVTSSSSGARGTTLVSFNDHDHLAPDHVTYR